MKKHMKKIIAVFILLFACYCVVDAVIEVRQETFPIKVEEIYSIDISLPNDAYEYPDGWQPTEKGTIETFTYDDLKLQISNVHSVRTETYTDSIDESYQWESVIYTYYPGAELTVLNADMRDVNGEAQPQWKISRISEDGVPYVPSAGIDIINYEEPLAITIEMDGVFHYESMIKVLRFEPYQEDK